jgi:hypothetical protein
MGCDVHSAEFSYCFNKIEKRNIRNNFDRRRDFDADWGSWKHGLTAGNGVTTRVTELA